MGRKNGNVQRSKDRGRRARQVREEKGIKARPDIQFNVEKMVTPDGRCFFRNRFGKDIFLTKEKAERALRQVQAQRRRSGTGHVERRYYKCPEGGCGGYHLTSRESYEERGKA